MCLATGRHSGLVGPGQLCLKKLVSGHTKKPYLESQPFPGALGGPLAPVPASEPPQIFLRVLCVCRLLEASLPPPSALS